jgi:hypothetical protein
MAKPLDSKQTIESSKVAADPTEEKDRFKAEF